MRKRVMKIQYKEAKSILTKSTIPGIDFVCNPYTGCEHGCIYCYASFMKRFTHHSGDIWGKFLDIKEFDFTKDSVKNQKNNKEIEKSEYYKNGKITSIFGYFLAFLNHVLSFIH